MCRPSAAVLAVLAVLAACVSGAAAAAAAAGRRQQLNYRPVIGVLAQENLPDDQFARGSSYIAASYVKYLEGAGARANDAGDYFPIWGTCQGFQQLSVLTANKNLLTLTDTKAVALPLTLTPAAQSSRLFRSFPKDLLQSLAEENITSNFHSWSLSIQNYSRNTKLKRFYKVLSTNNDGKKEFISTMEAYRYPLYAVQWHPEKSPFEWIDKPGMSHSTTAVRASFYTASFFVSEAMKNQHHFSSAAEEERALIYNFSPVFRGTDAIFVQNYYFD
ncbi:hypothetical protein FQN60_009709 [Etheostoma spectabile]|uniref:folate gamma-glutamyl hydrolase n=1 Tax=Etheostoma spectabile TaxID=54343 RepID=A0A5J5DJX6_9PERO|nr:hypothetical protein FQN60_009709 [Etheostoma spectabile]